MTQARHFHPPMGLFKAMANFLAHSLTLALAALATGCASLSLDEIKPSATTEAEVRARWGEPGRVWPATANATVIPAAAAPPNASVVSRALEYSRQPFGHTTFMVDIGADGKVSGVRQVLTAENFKNVVVGMPLDAVLRMLGKPMAVAHFARKDETHYDWRYLDGRQWDNSRIFYVVFDKNMQVASTGSIRDPDLDPKADPYVVLRPMQRQWQPQKIRGSHV